MPCSEIAGCRELQVKPTLQTRLEFAKQLADTGAYKKDGVYAFLSIVAVVLAWAVNPTTLLPPFLLPTVVFIKMYVLPPLTIFLGWKAAQGAAPLPKDVPASSDVAEPEGQ